MGTIEVMYESTDCCSDPSGWVLTNSSVLEPSSCSVRTCKPGKPAQWDRTQVFQGWVRCTVHMHNARIDHINQLTKLLRSCGCCSHNGLLVQPGQAVQLEGGQSVTCCEGELVQDLATGVV